MRALKFRVWNGVEWCGKIQPNQLVDPNDYDTYKTLTYQQFTGLLDRNGNEIYEGDIIAIFSPTKKCNLKTKRNIEFKYGAFCAIRLNVKFDYEKDFGMPFNCCGGGNPWVIIGNILEHPELLN